MPFLTELLDSKDLKTYKYLHIEPIEISKALIAINSMEDFSDGSCY